MPNITVRDIPDILYQDIKKLAQEERRSINGQIVFSLAQYVKSRKSAAQRLKEVQNLRATMDVKGFYPTQEELKSMVEEGRQ